MMNPINILGEVGEAIVGEPRAQLVDVIQKSSYIPNMKFVLSDRKEFYTSIRGMRIRFKFVGSCSKLQGSAKRRVLGCVNFLPGSA